MARGPRLCSRRGERAVAGGGSGRQAGGGAGGGRGRGPKLFRAGLRGWRADRAGPEKFSPRLLSEGAGPRRRCTPAAMAFRRRTKSYPLFSQEFIIHNHADICFFLVLCVLIGLMFEVSRAGWAACRGWRSQLPSSAAQTGLPGPHLGWSVPGCPARYLHLWLCALYPPWPGPRTAQTAPLTPRCAGRAMLCRPLGHPPYPATLSESQKPMPGPEPVTELPSWPYDWGFLSGVLVPMWETPRPAVIAQSPLLLSSGGLQSF